jgi:hypothetical protein
LTPDLTPTSCRLVRPAPRLSRRLHLIWGLAFLNVLPYYSSAAIISPPTRVGQALTQGALVVAFVLALTINHRAVVRPNLFLAFYTVLGVTSLMSSVRGPTLGYDYRAGRLLLFIALLWLLTPLWGTPDLVIARVHQRCLSVILAIVVLGIVIAPGTAFASGGRLGGAIWPMPATQVAHYSATLVGLTAIMWMCRLMRRRIAVVTLVTGTGALILTHTRTAPLAMVVGLVLATLSLLITHRRARRVLAGGILVLGVSAVTFTPVLTSWVTRGQDAQQLATLTGRTKVWGPLVASSRPLTDQLIGSGVSNASFDGKPIDNGWLTTYHDQGLIGTALLGAALLTLVIAIASRPPGAARAMALFLVAYVLVASLTETGIGGATTYLLDLAVAASLLVPATTSSAGLEHGLQGRS